MKRLIHFSLSVGLVLIFLTSCALSQPESNSKPVDHTQWTKLLSQYVDDDGMVDYKALVIDSNSLKRYLDLLEQSHPNDKNWTKDEQLAYWINAYNAFTIQLILRNYPVESIKDITAFNIPMVHSPWDVKFIEIEGHRYDLNNLEHGIIRKQFEVPEIHFALVCAAKSCPKLRSEAYIAVSLDEQLEDQARQFINDPMKNDITREKAELSKLFFWYKGDFTQHNSLAEYIDQFARQSVSGSTSIDFKEYDWALNEQQ